MRGRKELLRQATSSGLLPPAPSLLCLVCTAATTHMARGASLLADDVLREH